VSGRARLRGAPAGIAGALALSLTLSGCLFGGASEPDIAATVEGTQITSAQVNELYDIFANTDTGADDLTGADGVKVDPKQIRATALSYRIKIAFIEYLAQREGAVIPPDDSKDQLYDELAQIGSLKVSGYQGQDLKVAARIEAMSKAIAKKLLPNPTVTRDELQQAYDERKDIVGKSFRATTDIAFMDGPESAAALKKALDKGEDFVKATDALGDSTLAAQTVDINPITPIQADLIQVVRKLDTGKTADPIRYDVGDVAVYAVLHQQKRVDLPALTLEQAKPELTKIVAEHKQFLIFDDWLKKQYITAKIVVNKYYGKWNPSFQAVV
jgi:hypothetical protein